MITFIFPVINDIGLRNLSQSLENIAPDIGRDNHVLCLVGDGGLFLKCRNLIPEVFDDYDETAGLKYLTKYAETENPFYEAKQYLRDLDEYVFLANCSVVIPENTIKILLDGFLDHPNAGFITGNFTEYPVPLWLKDIYSDTSETIKSDSREITDNMPIDTIFPFGMLTKREHYLEYYPKKDKPYRNLAYGINLRRKGFTNYLTTKINYNYGVNNAKDNLT